MGTPVEERIRWLERWCRTELTADVRGAYLSMLERHLPENIIQGVRVWMEKHGPGSRFPAVRELDTLIIEWRAVQYQRNTAPKPLSEPKTSSEYQRACWELVRCGFNSKSPEELAKRFDAMHSEYPDRGWDVRAQKLRAAA